MAKFTQRNDDGTIIPGSGATGDDSGDAGNLIDPATVAASTPSTGDDSRPRRRGRPAGSTNKSRTGKVPADLSGLEGILLSGHNLLAAIADNANLKLEQGEAAALADGIRNVARHYDFISGQSQKVIDWSNLIMVAGAIYGAKLYQTKPRPQQTITKPTNVQTNKATIIQTVAPVLPETQNSSPPTQFGDASKPAQSEHPDYFPEPLTATDGFMH